MQTITSDVMAHLKAGKQVDVKIVIEGIHASTIVYTSEIVAGSVVLDRNSVSGETIEIGNAETSEFAFELDNTKHQWDTFKFEGAVLTVDFIIGSESLRAGKFIVDQIEKKQYTLKITALDYMAKFNRRFGNALSGETTLGDILTHCCTACEVTQYTMSFPNSTYATAWPDDEELTYHELISYVAELAGANAWVDHNGELRLTWYGQNQGTTEIELSGSDRFSYGLAENDIRITGLSYITNDTEYIVGTDIYALTIENNPLVVESTVSTLLNNIFTIIGQFTYRPYSFNTKFYPHIWPLDVVKITDAAGYVFNSIVTNSNLTLNKNTQLSAKGKSTAEVNYAEAAPFTARQKKVLERVIDLRAGQQITALDQAMIQLNELAANAQGYYSTVITEEDGSRVDYLHDQTTLATSTIIYKRSADGFFWTDSGGWPNPTWTSGYTASGNIVAKTLSAVGINADWINTGSITSQNFSGTGDGSVFSTTGTKINLNDGTIASPGFRLDSTGAVEVSGKITASSGSIGGFTIGSTTIKGGELTLGSDGSIKVVDQSAYYGFDVSGSGMMTASYAKLTCPAITKAQASSFGMNGDLSIDGIGQITSTRGATFGGTTYYCTISSTGAISTTSTVTVGSTLTVNGSLDHNGASIGFFNTTPTYARSVTAPSTITTIGTADATYSSNEQTMLGNLKTDVTNLRTTLNNLWTALNAYGLV